MSSPNNLAKIKKTKSQFKIQTNIMFSEDFQMIKSKNIQSATLLKESNSKKANTSRISTPKLIQKIDFLPFNKLKLLEKKENSEKISVINSKTIFYESDTKNIKNLQIETPNDHNTQKTEEIELVKTTPNQFNSNPSLINSKKEDNEFTINDFRFLNEIIEKERINIANEIKETTKYNTKNEPKIILPTWIKLRRTLRFITKMKHLTNEIKTYGTSLELASLNLNIEPTKGFKKTNKRYVLNSDGIFLTFWNFLMFIVLLYSIFITPVRITFFDDLGEEYPQWIVIEITIYILLWLDILITLNTELILDGKKITNRFKIGFNYLKTYFMLDVFGCFPFELFINYGYNSPNYSKDDDYLYIINLFMFSRFYELFRLFKWIKLLENKNFQKYVNKFYDFLLVKSTHIRLFNFFLTILICLHVVSCLWYFAAKIRGFTEFTWIGDDVDILYTYSFLDYYIFAFYWACSTLCTVGYGNIHSNNDLESFLAIIWMILGAGFYSYTIGSISSMMTGTESRRSHLLRKKIILESFAKEHKLAKDLVLKVKTAIEYNSKKSVFSYQEKNEILNEVPSELKFEIATSMFSGRYKNIPFLKGKEKLFISEIVPKLVPVKIHPGEWVYRKNDYPHFFYIIIDGRINLTIGPHKTTFKTLVVGSYFGEIEMFDNVDRLFSTQGACHSELFILPKIDLEKILISFPSIKREMKTIAKQKKIKIEESLNKIEYILKINKFSEFWNRKQKSEYFKYKERKLSYSKSFVRSPTLTKKSTLKDLISNMLRRPSINSSTPLHSLRRFSIFSPTKTKEIKSEHLIDQSPINIKKTFTKEIEFIERDDNSKESKKNSINLFKVPEQENDIESFKKSSIFSRNSIKNEILENKIKNKNFSFDFEDQKKIIIKEENSDSESKKKNKKHSVKFETLYKEIKKSKNVIKAIEIDVNRVELALSSINNFLLEKRKNKKN